MECTTWLGLLGNDACFPAFSILCLTHNGLSVMFIDLKSWTHSFTQATTLPQIPWPKAAIILPISFRLHSINSRSLLSKLLTFEKGNKHFFKRRSLGLKNCFKPNILQLLTKNILLSHVFMLCPPAWFCRGPGWLNRRTMYPNIIPFNTSLLSRKWSVNLEFSLSPHSWKFNNIFLILIGSIHDFVFFFYR